MSTKPLNFKVIEDNGGGLHLYIFNQRGRVTHAFHDWEYQEPGYLAENLTYLREGGRVDAWDNNDPDPSGDYTSMTSSQYGWEVVADNDGTYPQVMGRAAQDAFAIEVED